MSVARDDKLHTALTREPGIGIGKIESVGLTVDFERDAMTRGRVKHTLEIQARSFAAQQDSVGRVADDVDEGMLDCPHHPSGDFSLLLAYRRVHGRDNDI